MRGDLVGLGLAVASTHAEQHEQPGPIDATASPSTVTDADETRWTIARIARTVPWVGMAAVDVINDYIEALPGDTRRVAHGEWGVTLDEERGGGWPLDVGLRLADGLLAAGVRLPYREGSTSEVLQWNNARRAWRASRARAGRHLGAGRPAGGGAWPNSSTGCWRSWWRARSTSGRTRGGSDAVARALLVAVLSLLGPAAAAEARRCAY